MTPVPSSQAVLELEPAVLAGKWVRLEPFAKRLKDEVRAALNQDSKAWAIMAASAFGDLFESWWETALKQKAKGDRIPYAIRRLADGAVVGTTSFLHVRPEHRGVEIGATFIVPDARRSAVNSEAKLLMLRHAFESGAVRVEFRVDTRNTVSQTAVERMGAKREGVLRRDRLTWTGFMRDTAVFSILDREWPAAKSRLEGRLRAYVAGGPRALS
jgi:RimJ/RimL family protein N-acetyltransferase